MAIRDKFKRALTGSRLSSESSSSAPSILSASSPTPSTSTAASAPESPSRLSSRLKAFSWRRRTAEKKPSGAASSPTPDPREKPFTETNLQYQAIFEPFTMTFGATRRLSLDDEPISPCTSRRNSVES